MPLAKRFDDLWAKGAAVDHPDQAARAGVPDELEHADSATGWLRAEKRDSRSYSWWLLIRFVR